jgi:SPASM domain peptide maturase of grasp-with-spasm system
MFKLFSSCILVRGAKTSLIYDTERNEFYDIPNQYIPVLNATEKNNLQELEEKYGKEIFKFLNQFIEKEIGFYTSDPELFTNIDLDWASPYKVNNAIIEVSEKSQYSLSKAIKELNDLGTIGYQIRCLDMLEVKKVRDILNLLEDSRALYIDLIYPYSVNVDYTKFLEDIKDCSRLISIKIFGSPEDKILDKSLKKAPVLRFCQKNILQNEDEIIAPKYFVTDISFFAEAQKYNLGLNRKVSITKDGEIKNYPNHNLSFGKVDSDTIEKIIETDGFKKTWKISNDQIEICKDCQYRYACVSNSEIITRNKKIYKLTKCNFDPYNNRWN